MTTDYNKKYSCIHYTLRRKGSEDLSNDTLRCYSRFEIRLIDMNITEEDILENAEEVIEKIEKNIENINTQRSLYGFLGNVSTGYKTNEIYSKKSRELGNKIQEKYDLNEGDMTHFDKVFQRIDKVINGELSVHNKKEDINLKLLCLYMKYMNAGRREIGDLSFNPDDLNHIDIENRRVVIGRCKTTTKNGIIVYDLPLEFILKLKEIYSSIGIDLDKEKPRTYFIGNKERFGKQNFYNLFKRYFPEITPTMWRRYYITKNSDNKNLKELKELAKNMGHSFLTQQNYKII